MTPVLEGDYDALVKVMGYLYQVRERTFKYDNLFEPLKEIMDLLKLYNVEFSEEVHQQLQVIFNIIIYIYNYTITHN